VPLPWKTLKLETVMDQQQTWVRVENCTQSIAEKELQRIFDQWDAGKDGWFLVGVPEWLASCKGPNRARQFSAGDYNSKPDVLWDSP